MTEELERTKRALAGARHALGLIERNPQVLARGDYLAEVQKEIDDILNPPEFVEVEVVRWYNIYPLTGGFHLDCLHGFATKEEADNDAGTERIGCQDIRVKVKRPVKRPVVKEITIKGRVDQSGTLRASDSYNATLLKDHTDFLGRHVTITIQRVDE